MSSIMSTTTLVPTSVLAQTVGAGIPRGAAVPMGQGSSLISRTLGKESSGLSSWAPHMPEGNARGILPGAPPPARGNPGGGGGGGRSGGGGGGNPGATGGGGNLPQQAPLTDKLVQEGTRGLQWL